MPQTGTQKVIKYGGKTGLQFCLDGYLVWEVLKMIPRNVHILGANVELGTHFASRKIPTPNALKKLGVSWMRETTPAKSCALVFDEVDRSTLEGNTKKVAEAMDIDYKKAIFRRLLLGNNEANGNFIRCTKEIKPDETDLRKKLKVMGLREATGKIQGLLADLSAQKYVCDFKIVEYKTAICRKEAE